MKIEYENKDATKFEELISGAVFRSENNFYMKIDSAYENGIGIGDNAVNLSTGELDYFPPYKAIENLDVTLKISTHAR